MSINKKRPTQKKKRKSQGFVRENPIATGFIASAILLVILIFAVDFAGLSSKSRWKKAVTKLITKPAYVTPREQSLYLDRVLWKNFNVLGINRSSVFKKLQTLKMSGEKNFFYFEYSVAIASNISSDSILKSIEKSLKEVGGKVKKFVEILQQGKNKKIDIAIAIPCKGCSKKSVITHSFVFTGRKAHIRQKKHNIALIIDDIGYSPNEARIFFEMSPNITLSLIPGLSFSNSEAKRARENGQAIMLHLPMEPQKQPRGYAKRNGAAQERMIFTNDSDQEIRKRVNEFIGQLPGIVGVNNHMGSKFTENEHKMEVVLSEVQKSGLFFLDSLTSSKSVGKKVCQSMGLPFAVRDVFIDNSDKPKDIRKQMEKILKKASRYGEVIAIGHPRPNTIRAIRDFVTHLDRSKFALVRLSKLLKRY